ncbi:MAG: efflux RND transporter periplasmic adaptor subunit [bacterium]|jgi:Cu(I)/Ag(I) efflux system membrane fusion protein
MVRVNLGVLVFLFGCIVILAYLAYFQRGQIDRLLEAGYVMPASGEGGGESGDFIYIDSMHPWITSDKPGTCPICGMELIKVSGEDAKKMQEAVKSGVAKVSLSPIDRLTSNAQVSRVEEITISPEIKTYGTAVAPETGFQVLTTWVEGRIEKFYVQETGVYLKKGAPLIDVYSPMLVEAQQEFLVSVRAKKKLAESGNQSLGSNTDKLIESGRRKLSLMGMTDKQIAKLESDGTVVDKVTVYARAGGIVMRLMATQGMYMMEGGEILEVANLSPIWVELNVYEQDIPRVAVGDRVELTATGLGGEVKLNGPVTLLLPEVMGESRTLMVRAEVNNPGLALRPGMFVEGKIKKRTSEKVLVVPRDSVLWSGKGAKVWIPTVDEPGTYVAKEIKAGRILGDNGEWIEVLDGLRKGQSVLSGAVFLIDSEAELMNVGAAADSAAEAGGPSEKDGGGDNPPGHVH